MIPETLPRLLPLPALLRKAPPWWLASILWAGSLWFFSSGPLPGPDKSFDIPHIDKFLHFGFFFGGGGLLAAALHYQWRPRPWHLILAVVLIGASIGALDEWHQSWVPGRSGNDFGDWLADALGTLTGVCVFLRLLPRLEPRP